MLVPASLHREFRHPLATQAKEVTHRFHGADGAAAVANNISARHARRRALRTGCMGICGLMRYRVGVTGTVAAIRRIVVSIASTAGAFGDDT